VIGNTQFNLCFVRQDMQVAMHKVHPQSPACHGEPARDGIIPAIHEPIYSHHIEEGDELKEQHSHNYSSIVDRFHTLISAQLARVP
jgi:hypothetical protein